MSSLRSIESVLYDMWSDATRRAGQGQCHYPHAPTLQAFARMLWCAGYDEADHRAATDGGVGAGSSEQECPY